MIAATGRAAFQWLDGFTADCTSQGLAEDLEEECLKAAATASEQKK
jgi:hypothetical protein